MEVKDIDDADGIILKIPRMKKKKPELVDFDNSPVKSGTYYLPTSTRLNNKSTYLFIKMTNT